MFRRQRAIFRQHIIKESTALCTPNVRRYYFNFGVIGCLFFLCMCCGRGTLSGAQMLYQLERVQFLSG
jgi:hypothetical protein